MGLRQIFDVFSRRSRTLGSVVEEIPSTTRNRLFLWCGDIFSNRRSYDGGGDYTQRFWEEIHRFLQLRHGRGQLSDSRTRPSSRAEDSIAFLSSCTGGEFRRQRHSIHLAFGQGRPISSHSLRVNPLLLPRMMSCFAGFTEIRVSTLSIFLR